MTALKPGRGVGPRLVLGCGAIVAAWWFLKPLVSGVAVSHVARDVGAVDPLHIGLLVLLWVVSAALHSCVVSLALPGLGLQRTVTLTLAGSAVKNTLPLGGPVATVVSWRMARRWGQTNAAFFAYSGVTRLLALVMKLVLPLVAVGCLTASSAPVPVALRWTAGGCAVALAVTAGAVAWFCRRSARPDRSRRDTGLRRRLRHWGRLVAGSGTRFLLVVRHRWGRLTATGLACTATQVVLLGVCLNGVGLSVPLAALVAAAAIERLGSLLAVTPGGAGVAEAGTIAWLITTGYDPTTSVAGVVLYRAFLIAMELPVGAALFLGWALRGRSRRTTTTTMPICLRCAGDCGCVLSPLARIPRAMGLAAHGVTVGD